MVSAEVSVVDATDSEEGFQGAVAVVAEDFAVKIEASEAVVALVVAAVIAASANKTGMPLLTPQPGRDLTTGLGVIVNVIETAVIVVVGITHALLPAHMMTDLVDPRRDTTEIEGQAQISSPSATDAIIVTTTAREMTTTGNVDTRVAMRIPENFVVTRSLARSLLIETSPYCLGGYVLSSRFRQVLFRLFILPSPCLLSPRVSKGKTKKKE